MVFSIIIAVLLVAALVLYFVMSRKLKTPTVVTELLTTKYNKRLDKLSLFLKKNQIQKDVAGFKSTVEKVDISWEAVQQNLQAIANIENNAKLTEEILVATKKQEVEEKLKNFVAPCKICEFAGELQQKNNRAQIFDVLGLNKSKLDFEQQRYFGSQFFYKVGDEFVFFHEGQALIVDPTNIFASRIVVYDVSVSELDKVEGGKIFEATINMGQQQFKQKVLATQKETIKYLQNYNKK